MKTITKKEQNVLVETYVDELAQLNKKNYITIGLYDTKWDVNGFDISDTEENVEEVKLKRSVYQKCQPKYTKNYNIFLADVLANKDYDFLEKITNHFPNKDYGFYNKKFINLLVTSLSDDNHKLFEILNKVNSYNFQTTENEFLFKHIIIKNKNDELINYLKYFQNRVDTFSIRPLVSYFYSKKQSRPYLEVYRTLSNFVKEHNFDNYDYIFNTSYYREHYNYAFLTYEEYEDYLNMSNTFLLIDTNRCINENDNIVKNKFNKIGF